MTAPKEVRVWKPSEIARDLKEMGDWGTQTAFITLNDHKSEVQALKADLEALVRLLNSVVKHTQDVQLEKNLEVYSLHEKIIKTIQPIAEKLGLIKALSQKGGKDE